ncbi:MAG: hypothetical protein GQ527_00040 [Bacteroidales bacterium]|nr:hypothetical protein [Bacteroidales bacterium]
MIKEMMVQGMDKIMLNCEEATYLITKSEVSKIGCVKRIQLKMHLTGCSLCRRFKVQSELIDQSLKTLEEIQMKQDHHHTHHLPKEKKEELQSIIDKA